MSISKILLIGSWNIDLNNNNGRAIFRVCLARIIIATLECVDKAIARMSASG
jgi:hypothetical protein